jgi:hypothetical protein
MTEPNTLDEQIDKLQQEANEKPLSMHELVCVERTKLKTLFTEHSKQAFLLGYEAGESIANGIAKTMTWEEAKAQLKRNKGEDNE